MKTYQQLTYEQRCQVDALKKTGMSQTAIANIVGVATICRELKRNTGLNGYHHQLRDQHRKCLSESYHAFSKVWKPHACQYW